MDLPTILQQLLADIGEEEIENMPTLTLTRERACTIHSETTDSDTQSSIDATEHPQITHNSPTSEIDEEEPMSPLRFGGYNDRLTGSHWYLG